MRIHRTRKCGIVSSHSRMTRDIHSDRLQRREIIQDVLWKARFGHKFVDHPSEVDEDSKVGYGYLKPPKRTTKGNCQKYHRTVMIEKFITDDPTANPSVPISFTLFSRFVNFAGNVVVRRSAFLAAFASASFSKRKLGTKASLISSAVNIISSVRAAKKGSEGTIPATFAA